MEEMNNDTFFAIANVLFFGENDLCNVNNLGIGYLEHL
jgi:hypothetical protein